MDYYTRCSWFNSTIARPIRRFAGQRVQNHIGIAFIEGIEWLVSLHGFSNVLNFVMKVKDSLHRKALECVFILADGIFEDIESAKWHRESVVWTIPKTLVEPEIMTIEVDVGIKEIEQEELPLSEDGQF